MSLASLLISCGIGAVVATAWRFPASKAPYDKVIELYIGAVFASVAAICFGLLTAASLAANEGVALHDLLLGPFQFSRPNKFFYFTCGLSTLAALLWLRWAFHRSAARQP
jgi:hypothetical protein